MSAWARLHASTRVLLVELVLIGVLMAGLGFLHYPLVLSYGWHKVLHIFGAVLFLGNIIVTALWMVLLAQTGQPALVRRAAAATQWADVAFTAPGVFLLVSNGLILVQVLGGLEVNRWAAWGLGLFALSGVLWFTLLIPTQQRMLSLATQADAEGTALGPAFGRALRRWSVAGTVATILPLVTLGLMVLKP